jgi:tRNA 2-thiouridine synthesizing protein A
MDPILRSNNRVDQRLDITGDHCPMTYVRVRLALDRMQSEQVLLVELRGDEPLRNVPRTAIEQGHQVLGMEPGAGGVTCLLIRKG